MSASGTWTRVLVCWALGLIVPICFAVGFTVWTDASGYFGINRTGSYTGDELFAKFALMRHRPHNALLLGDSRAAFSDVSIVDELDFLNAASGGAGWHDTAALIRRHDFTGLELVVVMVPVGDLTGGCDARGSRLDDPFASVREGATVDAFARAIRHRIGDLRGMVPDHRADGTRFPDSRVLTPYDWDGGRGERYRLRVHAEREAGDLAGRIEEAAACLQFLADLREELEGRGAELLVVLPPINADLLDASGTNPVALSEAIGEHIVSVLPFVADFTAGTYANPASFPPRDAVHFRPEIGGEILLHAIRQFCAGPGVCGWRQA